MSKKTRKKIVRKNLPVIAGANAAATDNKSAVKSAIKALPAAGKVYLSSVDLEKRYQYVQDDLKRIAIIAIPMVVILILASFFIKV